jgi:hypothetical protein
MLSYYSKEARSDFDAAYSKAFRRELLGWISNRRNSLIPFDEIRKILPIKGQHWIGIQQVPLAQIVGSEGRYQDFDSAFSPRQIQTMGRWISVDVARLQDINLPPVELYKVGDVYFVKDGNHRVSVASENHQVYIDAEVIEIDVEVPITKETNIEKLILDLEQAAFYYRTQIKSLLPDAHFEFTVPGQYEKLLEHINVHRWYMGEQQKREVSYPEAIISWYETVYHPLIAIIRQKKILKDFPQRSEADLYYWIIEHHWFMVKEEQAEISLEAAAEDYRAEFSERFLKKILNLLKSKRKHLKASNLSAQEVNQTEIPLEEKAPDKL